MFTLLANNFVVLRQKLYLSTSLISTTALHIEIISLVDGMYELIQEPDGNISEAQTRYGIN